jgi:hypothetical protein
VPATIIVIASVTPTPRVGEAVTGEQVIPVGAAQVMATVPLNELKGVMTIVPVPVFPCATATSWVVVISEKSLAFNVTVNGADDCAE